MTQHAGAIPPGGFPIPLAPLLRGAAAPAEERLSAGLRALCGVGRVGLRRSGREALRETLVDAARRSGPDRRTRDEVIIPAYTCFSVPSAVVAAGLRVRLVDTDERGWIDREDFARLPLEHAAALVVCNLFGVPEPIADLVAACRDAGVAVVDDAAQALGGRGPEGPVGGRGDCGIASFGRGKPLQGLGGGARLAPAGAQTDGDEHEETPRVGLRARATALARAAAFDASLRPRVFAGLARIPGLGIGRNHFDPSFARGGIAPAALWLAAAELPRLRDSLGERVARARALGEEIAAATGFVPLLAPAGSTGVHPRLALRAPDAEQRDRSLHALARAGASPLYAESLDRLAALAPHRAGSGACAGAADLAARLVTLPTHGLGGDAGRRAILEALAR